MEERLNAIGDFVVGVGGVQNGDMVADINACNGFLYDRLHRLGARVRKVQGWHCASSHPLPMPSGCADVVFANMVLHHMCIPAQAIAEMKRVLRPGGRLVLTEMDKYDDVSLKGNRNDRWMGFYTSDVRHWLKKAGFSNIIVNPLPYQMLGFDVKRLGNGFEGDIFLATGTA